MISDCSLSVELVPATEQSARLIMEWRNDPQTLANSFDSRPKQWPAFHDEFLENYCADASLPCLFVLNGGTRIGFMRFRRIPQLLDGLVASDISINLAPAERGKGYASAALVLAEQVARNAGVELLIADVMQHNPASKAAFEKIGYVKVSEHNGVNKFVKRLIAQSNVSSTRAIGPGNPCFVIAEAGSNWRMGTPARDRKMAKALIDVAVEAGADAVKFQTYKASTTYVENAGQSDYLADNGIQESITDIFADLTMPYEMIPELAEYCQKQGIIFMSSPFSVADFEAIDPYTPIHKIASYEISHVRLIEAIARSGKPCVMSTGASAIADIQWAVNYFQQNSKSTLSLMQCTARYPAPLSSLNLGSIALMKKKFGIPVGLSDHSRDAVAGPLAAVALGADLIEKHYTLDNRLPGPDHAFALTPEELKQMVNAIRAAEQVLGPCVKVVQPEEEELFWYARRGLQAIKPIRKGEAFVEDENFAILRPGKQKRGAHPKFMTSMVGAKSNRDIALGDGIQPEDFAGQGGKVSEDVQRAGVK